MVTLQDVMTFVETATDDQLDILHGAAKARTKALRANAKMAALAQFTIGDKVELFGLSPKYLNGCTGTIASRDLERFEIQLDDSFLNDRAAGRYGKSLNVPANCVKAAG